jgi:hypothetical protein
VASSQALVVPNCPRIHTLRERVCHMSYLPSLLEIIEKSNLHGGLRQVYIALVAYAERYGEPVSPSLSTLAKSSDMSRRQVIRCLHQLARQGYVTLIRRHDPGAHAKNLYALRFPWQDEKALLKVGDMPILKVGDTRARVGFKTQDKREKKEQVGDMPLGDTNRHIPPEVLNYPKHIDWVNRNLTPGSVAYAAALSDTTPDPVHQTDRLAAFQESDADVRHPIVEPGPGRGVGWRYYVGISSTGDYVVIIPPSAVLIGGAWWSLKLQKARDGYEGREGMTPKAVLWPLMTTPPTPKAG